MTTATDGSAAPPRASSGGGWLPELGLFVLVIVLALALRAPALLYSVTNFDESLYLLFGDDLARGILPYTHICDRKPFGLFALYGLFASIPFDTIYVLRIAASLSVGLTAYLLHRVVAMILDDHDRLVGPAAALAYVAFSLVSGGIASNSEVFVNLFAVLGLLLLLAAARGADRPRLLPLVLSGIVLGVGIQVKPTLIFDMAAFFAGYYLLTTPRLGAFGAHVRATFPRLVALGVIALLPSIAVIGLYVWTGHWDAWAAANLGGNRGFVEPDSPIRWGPALRAMTEQGPIWLGALAAILGAPWLLREDEGRSFAFLLVWVAAIVVLQLILRIAADHYFIQFLPPLCVLSGLVLGRGVLGLIRSPRAQSGVLAAVMVLTIFALEKNTYVNAATVLRNRVVRDKPWNGDTPRMIAHDLEGVIQPGDALYEVGFLPMVYHLTGAVIPTRFAFTGLPHPTYEGRDGCPWVPPDEELRRVLDTKPRFIVVEDGVFYEDMDPGLRQILDDRLGTDYRLVKRYRFNMMHRHYPFEKFVMNSAAPAFLYELRKEGEPAGPKPEDARAGLQDPSK